MTDYLGSEAMEPDGYLQPTRYRIKAKCGRCNHVYSWIANSPGGANKPCPKAACKEAAMNEEIERRALRLAKMLEEQRAPGVIGQNRIVQAIDTTAEIVMKDHGLTNLQDNVREGDILAPKLPHKMQQAADGFFGGVPKQGVNRQVAARMNARVGRALRGQGIKVNPSIVASGVAVGEQAIRKIGTEANSGWNGTGSR